jgi:hypothetical protein
VEAGAGEDGVKNKKFIPCTPAGTLCTWLSAGTKEKAIANLMKDAAHMPYKTWENFQKRGYTIEEQRA